MKRFDMRHVLKGLDGEELQMVDGENNQTPLTVRHVLMESCSGQRVPAPMNPETKMQAYNLMQRIHTEDEVTLTQQEIQFLSDETGKWASPLVYGRLHDWLNAPGLVVEKADANTR